MGWPSGWVSDGEDSVAVMGWPSGCVSVAGYYSDDSWSWWGCVGCGCYSYGTLLWGIRCRCYRYDWLSRCGVSDVDVTGMTGCPGVGYQM